MLGPETPQAAAGAAADEPTDASWDAERADALDTDRSIELDPGRVHGDDLQSDAERSEGEPDE
jgi:hypothetical protein